MLNTAGRFMYAKYWGIHVLYVEHCGKICLYKIVFCMHKSSISVQHKYFSVFWVNKYSNSVQQKVFPRILCNKSLLKDLFTQNSGEYLCWTLFLLEDLFTYNTWNTLCWTLGRFIYTKHWEILGILMLNTWKIYLHKILGILYSVQHKVFPSILCK
jgi:hypothetical protein